MKISKRNMLMGGLIALSLIVFGCEVESCEDDGDCPPPPPAEPRATTVEVGNTAVFFVYAVTGDAYQWYVGKSKVIAGSNFTAISGATKDTLIIFDAQLSQDSSYVYCAEKSSKTTSNAGPALLHVIPDST